MKMMPKSISNGKEKERPAPVVQVSTAPNSLKNDLLSAVHDSYMGGDNASTFDDEHQGTIDNETMPSNLKTELLVSFHIPRLVDEVIYKCEVQHFILHTTFNRGNLSHPHSLV